MEIMLAALKIDSGVSRSDVAGHTVLLVEPGAAEPAAIATLRAMSSLYMLCRGEPGGAFYPLCGRPQGCIGDDLSGILKYKGKTSETFTRLLINVARFSSEFALTEGALDVLDPVCGKGTTLLEAWNMGFNAFGVDVDEKGLNELENFIRRYMTFNRRKHKIDRASVTANGTAVPVFTAASATSNDAWKAGERILLSTYTANTSLAGRIFNKKRFHIIAGDLPYGVQHAAYATDKKAGANRRHGLEEFVQKSVPIWSELLLPGGCMALSFNSFTLSRAAVRDAMRAGGLDVLEGGPYDGMEHWVEQAVNRDVAVAVKRA